MLVAAFWFALMGLLVKLAGHRYGSTELVFYRSLTGMVAILLVAAPRPSDWKTPYWRLHLQRSLCGIASLWLYFFALTRLPLATAVTLNYTSPLFLALLAVTWLGERAHARLLMALVLGFAGVVLVLKPHLARDQALAGFAGLVSGLFAGMAYLNVRAMGAVREPEWRIVLVFTLSSTVLSGLALLASAGAPGMIAWLPDPPRWPVLEDLPLLLGIGLCALAGQLCMTRAYKTGALWLASNFAYSAIVFSSLLGWVFHAEHLAPLAWTGMLVIIVAGVMAGLARERPAPE